MSQDNVNPRSQSWKFSKLSFESQMESQKLNIINYTTLMTFLFENAKLKYKHNNIAIYVRERQPQLQ